MIRKEEREQASFEYYSKPYLGAIKDDFVNGAEWADKTMLDKACEWLSKHAKKYYFNKDGHYLGTDELVEDFKLSMEL